MDSETLCATGTESFAGGDRAGGGCKGQVCPFCSENMFLVGRVVMAPSSPLPPERLSFLPQSHHSAWVLFDSARLREQRLLLYDSRRRRGWRENIPVLLCDLGEKFPILRVGKPMTPISCCAQKCVL